MNEIEKRMNAAMDLVIWLDHRIEQQVDTSSSSAQSLIVGQFGTGTLTIQSGGTLSITTFGGVIGSTAGSQGTVTVTGAGSTWTMNDGITVGSCGTGTLTIANGGMVVSPFASIGALGPATATVTGVGRVSPGTGPSTPRG